MPVFKRKLSEHLLAKSHRYITTGEFHTARSRIVLNSYGAVITKLFCSVLFHMDLNTILFRRPTKGLTHSSVKFHIHRSIVRVYIYTSAAWSKPLQYSNVKQYMHGYLWLVLKDATEFKEELLLVPTSWYKFVTLVKRCLDRLNRI